MPPCQPREPRRSRAHSWIVPRGDATDDQAVLEPLAIRQRREASARSSERGAACRQHSFARWCHVVGDAPRPRSRNTCSVVMRHHDRSVVSAPGRRRGDAPGRQSHLHLLTPSRRDLRQIASAAEKAGGSAGDPARDNTTVAPASSGTQARCTVQVRPSSRVAEGSIVRPSVNDRPHAQSTAAHGPRFLASMTTSRRPASGLRSDCGAARDR